MFCIFAWFTATGATLSAATNQDTIGVTNNAAAADKQLTVKWFNEGGNEITGETKATAVNPSVQELSDTSATASETNVLGLHTYYYDSVANSEVRAKNDASLKKSAFATFTIDTTAVASASYAGHYKLTVQTSTNSKIRINSSDTWTTSIALNTPVVLGYMHISDAGVVTYTVDAAGTGAALTLKIFYAVEPIIRTAVEDGSGSYGSLSLKIGD